MVKKVSKNKIFQEKIFRLFSYTEAMRKEINAEIPPQQMLIFLFVAMNEGCMQQDIAISLSMPEGTVSRNVAKLSQRWRKGRKGKIENVGYGMLESKFVDPLDQRIKGVYLTPRGVKILHTLMKTLY